MRVLSTRAKVLVVVIVMAVSFLLAYCVLTFVLAASDAKKGPLVTDKVMCVIRL